MKKILISLMVLLIIPSLLHAEASYFIACKDGKIINVLNEGKSKNFKRGDLFEVPKAAQGSAKRPSINKDKKMACWSKLGDPICPLVVNYGNTRIGTQGVIFLHGFVDLELGCWFESEGSIPIKNNKAEYLDKLFGFVNPHSQSPKDEYYEQFLDKEFVDIMCSEHPTQFYAAGILFTDVKKEKSEHAKQIEKDRQLELAREEKIRQDNEAREARVRQEEQKRKELKIDRLGAELKKYNVQSYVSGQDLLANPFRYKGKIVATPLVFIRMLEESVGVFGVGNPGYPTEDIVVSHLPVDLFGDNSLWPSLTLLVVKVQGTTSVTNRMGARFNAPHLEYIARVTSDWR